VVEVTSVNRKQSEVAVYLPAEIEIFEPQIRTEVNRRVARGKVTAKVTLHTGDDSVSGVQINVALAKAYARELRKLSTDLKLAGELTLEVLVRAPGVFKSEAELDDPEALWPVVAKALEMAVGGLIGMREREGAHLAADLKKRIATMKKSVALIQKQAPKMVQNYQEQLRQRIKNAGLELPAATDERLLKEVVYFADRSDVSEELTRLQSHFKQFDDCVKSDEPVGRTLDFLAQELNREINTIGSKSSDSLISREVVHLKAELEKFREQVQNVE
ncbi:MAG: hypothetical protein JWM99_1629, partial [Verrucomicrobiales bacterium]|nr:hypothetical protein [Verrucomicrobiales bacterium]